MTDEGFFACLNCGSVHIRPENEHHESYCPTCDETTMFKPVNDD